MANFIVMLRSLEGLVDRIQTKQQINRQHAHTKVITITHNHHNTQISQTPQNTHDPIQTKTNSIKKNTRNNTKKDHGHKIQIQTHIVIQIGKVKNR